MSTGADILVGARRIYNDIDDTAGLDLLQKAHDFLLRFVRIYPEEVVDINLVAGTREYALDSDVLRVWEAEYRTSATTATPLEQTSTDWLDYNMRGWRSLPNGTPSMFYDIGGYIGLVQKPDTTSSGGYPIVRGYATKRQTLVGATALPLMIREQTDAWEDEIAYRWARQTRSIEDIKLRDAARRRSRNELMSFLQGRLPRNRPHVESNIPEIHYP